MTKSKIEKAPSGAFFFLAAWPSGELNLNLPAENKISRAGELDVFEIVAVGIERHTKVVATELYAPNVAALAAAAKGEVIRQPLTPHRPGQGLTGCMRNMWLHNLTQFLAARKKIPGGATAVG